jgi:hypothetical protein
VSGKIFEDVKSVLVYLQETRQIGQAKLYKDVRAGYLRRQKDGTFRLSDVDRYAASLKPLSLPQKETDNLSALAAQEQEERVLSMQEKRRRLVFEREVKEGKYIPRDEVALELAGRAMALSVGLRSALQVAAPDLILAADGDKNRGDDLVREIERHLDEALNEFSRPMTFAINLPEDEHVQE